MKKVIHPICLGFVLFAAACGTKDRDSDDGRGNNNNNNSVQCNPACPAGQRCVAGTNGGPNECIAGMQSTGGGIGAACTNAATDCSVSYCAVPQGATAGYCTDDCTGVGSQGSCPATFECSQQGNAAVCVKPTSGPGPGPGPGGGVLGATCAGGADCASQLCAQSGSSGYCTETCNGACAAGYTCSAVDGASYCLRDTGPPPPPGGLNCVALNDCINPCTEQTCVDMCVAQSDQGSINLLSAVYDCIEMTMCTTDTCPTQCGTQINACVNDP